MMTVSKYVGLLASESPCRETKYDEERLRWSKRGIRFPRLPRLRKKAICLLVIDVAAVLLVVSLIGPLITLLRRNEELFGPRFVDPARDSNGTAGAGVHQGSKIPRILHQTCATAAIPDQWVYPQHTCKEAYADFEYKLWTDELAREFIASEYPWFLNAWDNYPFPIQRADSIRYIVLYHFGGLYLDMDTVCKEPFPIDQIKTEGQHYALFKSTLPTGVTNDFMLSTSMHPAFTTAIFRLPVFYEITQLWARLEPYVAIMLSSGPLFLTLAVKDYLLQQASLPSPTVEVVASSELNPYITDLESSTWHRQDTQVLMWMGERPWSWFGLGLIGLVIGIYLLNRALLLLYRGLQKVVSAAIDL